MEWDGHDSDDDFLYDSEADITAVCPGGSDDGDTTLEKNYTILNEAEIRRRQDQHINDISSVLSLSKSQAILLLYHYNWKVSPLHDEWFADEQAVCNKVGLFKNSKPNNTNENNNNNSCGICFDEFDTVEVRSVSCGHVFCVTCWKGYISASINDRGIGCLSLMCPGYKCRAAVGQDLIKELASKEEKEKYDGYMVKSYVECRKERTKWCPAPGCECAIEFEFDGENCGGFDVACDCSYAFCWKCVEEPHRPVECELVTKWIMKNSSEAENTKWILAYSKPCPKCERPIEKHTGCNHMTCGAPCKHQFCWVCLQDWKNHSSSYTCNTFKTTPERLEKHNESERIRAKVKEDLERYKHYYERWAGNHKSRQQAIRDLIKVESLDILILSAEINVPETQLDFIVQAWKQIVECRRVLKWSYAYGYYLEQQPGKKQFFEYLQGEAESYLERLHGCAENDLSPFLPDTDDVVGMKSEEGVELNFNDYRSKLVSLTKVTGKYFDDLVRALENGLSEVKVEDIHQKNDRKRKGTGSGEGEGEGSTSSLQNRVVLDRDLYADHWSCDQCTYANPAGATSCQMCYIA